MPSVNLKSIDSFSSEDPNHPASNLLKPGNKKWKCCEAGEKVAYVVIRLDEPIQISGIDIGNEHSAFIEVLVGRSGPSNPTFTELLLSTKFMNPVESRNSTSPNRVQFFNKSVLIPSTSEEKWDLVKIVCSQPFNARVKYGLTFVALHTTSAERKDKSLVPDRFQKQIREEAEKGNAANVVSFGRFKLREDSPDSDEGNVAGGSSDMFTRWKEKLKPNALNVTTSVSALMRDSATPEGVKRNIPAPGSVRNVLASRPKPQQFDSSDDEATVQKSNDKPETNRNSVAVLYDEEDEKPDKKLGHGVARDHTASQKHEPQKGSRKAEGSTKNASKLHDTGSSKFKEFLDFTGQSMDRGPQRTNEEKSKAPMKVETPRRTSHGSPPYDSTKAVGVRTSFPVEQQTVPKKRLSSPSATENSKESRSPLSKKVKTVVAVTKSDEEPEKRLQYKPFGRLLENVVLVISGIQNPERGDIRSKALAMGAKYKPDWDSSSTHLICAYRNTPKYNQVRGKGKIIKKEWITACYNNRKRFSWRKFAMDSEEANEPDSEDEIVDIANKPPELVDARPDVEEGEAVMLHELVESDSDDGGAARAHASYDLSTEDEREPNGDGSTGGMDFFKGKSFYLDSELDAVDIIKLKRSIQAYKGTIRKDLQDVDYVISRYKHKLPPSSRAKLVKPLWIYECDDMECLIPITRYVL
uniref:BRCT domain-containing protein n=1 Tax=Anopheles atroparvus TaxID=41427 RepID=A0AAG5D003_ANOAO